MSENRISVALCTYNGSRFLHEQLDSIARQSQIPDEVVVCDDGSTDATHALLDEFASNASFLVRIVHNPDRLGPTKNFEKAIQMCKGDTIFLCDQDDIWVPEKLKVLSSVLDCNPNAAYAFSDAVIVNDNSAPQGRTFWAERGLYNHHAPLSGPGQIELLLRENFIPGAAMAIRASYRRLFLPIPVGWMHDYWIALLGSLFARGVPVEEPLLYYRRHVAQVCGSKQKPSLKVMRASLRAGPIDCWKRVRRIEELLQRVDRASAWLSCSREGLATVQQKEIHLSRRAAIRSSSGSARVLKILGETATGRYRRFSGSTPWDAWHSIARDLF